MENTIKEISEEMRKQDHRATQNVLFVIMDNQKVPCPEGQAEGIKRMEDYEAEDLCEDCIKKYEDNENLPESCFDCDPSMFWDYKMELVPQLNYGVFFTAKACEEVIKANRYHFEEPISYGIAAWRNYEMQTVQQYLLSLTGIIPNHYKY